VRRLGIHRLILYDSCTFLYERFKQAPGWHVLKNSVCLPRPPTRGAVSALPQHRNSHTSFPRICVVFLRRSPWPSWNAQAGMMGVSIVRGGFVAENLSHNVVQSYSSILRGTASRFPISACSQKVALRKSVAIST
jgi:hypothetical protein